MKKLALGLAVLLTVGLLAACGSQTAQEEKDVDLTAFYTELAGKYSWVEDAASSGSDDLLMTSIEGEMLESYYPGLSDLATVQLVAKMPMMSSLVNEVVFAQCGSEEDAEAAEAILQERIDYQVGDETNPGGAWYPESIVAWKQAQVIRHGTYVALIASAEHQTEIADAFNQLFA